MKQAIFPLVKNFKQMKIGIFCALGEHYVRGPKKLVENTIAGLEQLGIAYSMNTLEEYNLCLTGCSRRDYLAKQTEALRKKTIMGPCCMNFPMEKPELFSMFPLFLTGSKWYVKNWQRADCTKNTRIDHWAAGIDTDKFAPKKQISQDVFIYYKSRHSLELQLLKRILNSLNLSFSVIKYGNYVEAELIDACNRSKACIILDHTETQGIGIMEILSLNVPCFVLDKNIWHHYGKTYRYNQATSVPYFDANCGKVLKEQNVNSPDIIRKMCILFQWHYALMKKEIETFFHQLDKYHPREYILKEHTLKKSTKRLIDHFKTL